MPSAHDAAVHRNLLGTHRGTNSGIRLEATLAIIRVHVLMTLSALAMSVA